MNEKNGHPFTVPWLLDNDHVDKVHLFMVINNFGDVIVINPL